MCYVTMGTGVQRGVNIFFLSYRGGCVLHMLRVYVVSAPFFLFPVVLYTNDCHEGTVQAKATVILIYRK